MKIEYITEQDVTGLGRIVVDGKFYGVPAKAVAAIQLVQKRMEWEASRAAKLDVALEDALRELAAYKSPEAA